MRSGSASMASMRAYYDRRAPEYDDWYTGEGLFAAVRLNGLFQDGTRFIFLGCERRGQEQRQGRDQ